MGYTYVISDIHGQLGFFEDILRKIDLQPDDKLYILGDVIDRGAHGIEILRRIMAMPNAEMLLGNHEFMMLDALGEPYEGIRTSTASAMELWYRNGGGKTHIGLYCLPKAQRREVLDYLKSRPMNIDVKAGGKEYRLVHAADIDFYGVDRERFRSETEYCVWDRKGLIPMARVSDKNYVFGHTGTFLIKPSANPKIIHKDNLIGIDCGCAIADGIYDPGIGMIKGRLGCIRLDDMHEFYSGNKSFRGSSKTVSARNTVKKGYNNG